MLFNKHALRLSVLALAALIGMWESPALAQESEKRLAPEIRESGESNPDAAIRDEIKQLKSELEQLRSLIEQQRLALARMEKRLVASDARTGVDESRATVAPAEVRSATSPDSGQSQTAGPPSPQQPNPYDKTGLMAGWADHAFLRRTDGSFETDIWGYVQFDYRGYQAGNHPPDTFLVRRARLAIEGKVERFFEYKLEGDFADTSSTLLRDFYLRLHRIDEAQLTVGQFKEPFSQEEMRLDLYQDFVERSMANLLAPSRSPGLMLSGSVGKGVFEYQVGAFNGKGLLALNNTGTPEGALRLRFSPWKRGSAFWRHGLAFGGAYAQGQTAIGTSVRGITESRSFSFFDPDTVNGKITRANGEFTWLLGPAALRAEYDQLNQSRDNLGPRGTNLPGVVSKAYMAQFTYLVTGETKPDAGIVIPKHSLFGEGDGTSPGFGAWELKVRYSNLQMSDATVKSNRAGSLYFGVNWYLNRLVSYRLDLGFEQFKDPQRTPRPGDHNYFVVLSRVQLAF
jgi:phosphate-selective porin OprO/OprP